jgi:hypothetical protein
MFREKVKVIISPYSGISVLNGATQYGFYSFCIKERVICQTIGTVGAELWNEHMHKEKKQRVDENGVVFCTETIQYFVHIEEKVGIDKEVVMEFTPFISTQPVVIFPVVVSPKLDLLFRSDPGA